MSNKIYLGRDHHGDALYLEKHSWDCGWYWGFGYIGNRNLHKHIKSLMEHSGDYVPDWHQVEHHFKSTWITQENWWILRDLFLTAYKLNEAAAAYRHGSHQTCKATPYLVINTDKAATLNKDLETILGNIWDYVTTEKAKQEARAKEAA